jgi:hypothetical protein
VSPRPYWRGCRRLRLLLHLTVCSHESGGQQGITNRLIPSTQLPQIADSISYGAGIITPSISRRVWKSLRIAKPAAAAAKCLRVCPLRIDPTE